VPDPNGLYDAAGQQHNVDPLLLRAIAMTESGETDQIQGPETRYGTAKGRMQFIDPTAAAYGVKNPYDPKQSVPGAAAYVSDLLNQYGNPVDALRAYNGGPDPSRWNNPETAAYPIKVAQNYARLKAQAATAGAPVASTQPAVNDPDAAAGAAFVQSLTGQSGAADVLQRLRAGQGASAPAAAPAAPADPDAAAGAALIQSLTQGVAPPPAPANDAQQPASPAPTDTIAPGLRAALQPAPNTTYGSVLPLARDNTTGQIRPALPSSLRDLASGALDLVEGPATGTVTPLGTMALASGLVPGGRISSPAADTGAAITQAAAANRLASNAPPPVNPLLSPEFTAAPFRGMPAPGALPSGAPASPVPPNMLAEPPAPVVAAVTKAPPGKILPIVTQKQADAEADRIIAHFAGSGSTAIDANPLYSGAKPTLSQSIQGGNAGIAGLERTVREMTPEAQNAFVAREAANQTMRADALRQITGTPADIAAAEAQRDAATAAAKAAVFAPDNLKPTDPTPALQKIDTILASGQGQRTVVNKALTDIRAKLADPQTGALQTDPEQLYGIRQAINDMISPKAAGTASDGRQAARELMSVKDALDPVIEQGAPGFQKYIKDYSSQTAPINGMQYLQGLNLTDANGKVQLGRLNNAINALQKQQAMPGARLADGVTDQQLNQLLKLRSEFQNDSKQLLGTPIGSPTVAKLGTNALLANMGNPLVHGLVGSMAGGPTVGFAAALGRYGSQKLGERGAAMVQQSLRNKLLNPEQATSAFPPTPP